MAGPSRDPVLKDAVIDPTRDSMDFSSDEDEGQEAALLNNQKPISGSRRGAKKPALASKASTRSLRPRSRLRSCMPGKKVAIASALMVAFAILTASWVYHASPRDGESPAWYPTPLGGTDPTWEESYKSAAELISRMSLVEKVNITTGTGWEQDLCVGNTGSTSSGFPALCLQDGPLGIRFADQITAWPAGITIAATWNKELMYKRGKAIGREARLKGVNVWLGPSMGPLGRMPAGGRNWEGFGPDAVLAGRAAAQTIIGVQEEGVIATAKHYILNEQEHFRQAFEWGLPNALSVNIDDRTLHEVYLWPFAESIRAGVGSIMCSYNMVNQSYACGNSKLLNGILKDELGFQGFVQSDWAAQRSGIPSALAGLDMSMPGDGLRMMDGDSYWGPHLTRAVLNGSLPIERLNDMTTRIVAAWYQMGQDDKTKFPEEGPNFSSWTHDEVGLLHPGSNSNETAVVNKFINAQGDGKEFHGNLARKIAAEATVLVKNLNNFLPLSRSGRASVQSLSTDQKFRVGVFGEDAIVPRDGPNKCPDRGCNEGTLAQGWGSGAVEYPYLVAPLQALREAFDNSTVYVTDFPTNKPPFKKAPEILLDQDLCLVFVSADSGEGYIATDGIKGDRNDLYLNKGGDELVRQVAEGCGRGNGDTVVVIHSVGAVVVEKWIDLPGVKAVIVANLPGEESGHALTDVLFGDENPSGKLPYTVGRSLEDYGPGGQVMYYPNSLPVPQQNLTDTIYIDYRHFDRAGIKPRYPFGFGLSYTTFELSNLQLKPLLPKSPLPSPRSGSPTIAPPAYDTSLPALNDALIPANFTPIKKYIYPYIHSLSEIKTGPYPYPSGYDTMQPPSAAGGGPGGNPSLYDAHLTISVDVTNTGTRSGQEVVQVYLAFPENVLDDAAGGSKVDFPVKVLRGFEKVLVQPGERKIVSVELTRKDLSYWSTTRQNWVMPTEGKFGILVGTSSAEEDLRLRAEF